jgi:hypothetical protein
MNLMNFFILSFINFWQIAEMNMKERISLPLTGKTFTLYGGSKSSDHYYRKITELTDSLLSQNGNIEDFLHLIRSASGKRRILRKLGKQAGSDDKLSYILTTMKNYFSEHTAPLEKHLKGLSLMKRFDKTVSMIEEQYFIYMLEIELVNRLYLNNFRKAEVKLGFLPYCLHDIDKNCKAKTDGIDFVCQKCSGKCYVNKVTTFLSQHNIKAYIWMEANLKSLFKKLMAEKKTIGVFGMACIPELVHGMELCMSLDIPVIGLPIDANRCRRWTGIYHQTTVNLKELEKLIADRSS